MRDNQFFMKSKDTRNHISYILVGEERWFGGRYFMPNIYPSFLSDVTNSCSERFALNLHHYFQLRPSVTKDKEDCLKQLNKHCVNLNIPDGPDRIAYYHSIATIACIHGFLYSVKSFLDIISTLWVSLASNKYQDANFSKKVINKKQLSGGVIINWLNHSSPCSFQKSKELANLIELNSKEWITESVHFRDELAHKGELSNLLPIRARVEDKKKRYESSDLMLPVMPNNIVVQDYFYKVITALNDFVFESLTLFENIDITKLKKLKIAKG
jgi:hypothetical protein